MDGTILLQTDFSMTWGAVASMKGVIANTAPDARVVDLCHDIKRFDPFEASLSLKAVLPYWPEGTIVVSVVDPGVGTERKASAALLKDGKIIITPDNGTLTHLKHHPGIEKVIEIDERYRYPSSEKVSVFHGRDIFAYCAALLSAGKVIFDDLGKEYPVSEVIECREYNEKPVFEDDSVSCFIMTGLRHFGGIEFNIRNDEWQEFCGSAGQTIWVTIFHGGKKVFDRTVKYEESFGFVDIGEPVLYRGSSGYLSLDCNQDSFMERYSIDMGIDWKAVLVRRR
jgi:hypothetical protein